ncbi:MAG: flagellar hook assembly protein FlgD [Burkholderiaceae bacterium]|nr:flagellar hook assembly protein FlgD [Burkholderiaceae bacterium]
MTSASTLTSLLDTSAAAGYSTTGSKDSAKDLNDRFLKLLVAQMKNQDPLNPLDNAQVTSQMAQINTVTGINGLNDTVNKLLEQFGAMEALQAAQLTGRSVLVTGNQLLADGKGAEVVAGVDLAAPADKVTAEILDAGGNVVRTIALGPSSAGISRFTWDGRTDTGAAAAAGPYSFAIKASSAGSEVNGTPLIARTVEAVTRSNGSTQLVLAGGIRIAYGDVKQIL